MYSPKEPRDLTNRELNIRIKKNEQDIERHDIFVCERNRRGIHNPDTSHVRQLMTQILADTNELLRRSEQGLQANYNERHNMKEEWIKSIQLHGDSRMMVDVSGEKDAANIYEYDTITWFYCDELIVYITPACRGRFTVIKFNGREYEWLDIDDFAEMMFSTNEHGNPAIDA